jgi:ABC-type glycerol-3-phosphate transport system substrate-binding protein
MKSKMIICLTLILLLLLPQTASYAKGSVGQQSEGTYQSVLNQWKQEGIGSASHFEKAIPPSQFKVSNTADLLPVNKSNGYGSKVFYWKNNDSISFQVVVKEDGLYNLGFNYFPMNNGLVPIEGIIKVNGSSQYLESQRIGFPVNWKSDSNTFQKDRYGNDIIPNQTAIKNWSHITAQDANYMYDQPLKFHLKKGTNTITLENTGGEALIGMITVTSPTQTPSYKQYLSQFNGLNIQTAFNTYEAEHPSEKNSSYINPVSTNNPGVTPYNSSHDLLNTIGGDSWSVSGQSASWKLDVNKDGLYHLSFKVLQNKSTGAPVYRTILIDGKVPFSELNPYTFNYSKNWENETLSDKEGKPYSFYLSKGTHTISLVADASPMEPVINQINVVTQGIDDLALSIEKLTGNQNDQSRDWNITDFIPNIKTQLTSYANDLEHQVHYLNRLSKGKQTKEIVSLNQSVDKLNNLAKSPNSIPKRLTELSEGSGSVAQSLGDLTTDLNNQSLLIDKFYVYGNHALPSAQSSFLKKIAAFITRFFTSFIAGNYTTSKVSDKNTIEVWVNRPRQYVEIMQNMADKDFTPKTGIKVKFSIMPDESRLILASAAGTQPDVALGISNYLPYDLALRGAAINLRQFNDFNQVAKNFSPGAFLPLIVNNGIYALPETQDFNVLFYRKDILDKLNLPIPNTWNDVLGILPPLQRYGMNFYTPIAGAVGSKPFQTTAPFIFQFDGNLYKDEGTKTAIDDPNSLKAIQFMTDLNTIYSLPLQVPNFYNHFRYGTLPIGISNFQTYVQLKTAAPEIANEWGIAPAPGVKQKDGTVARWQTGSAQSAMIFKGTKKLQKSWEFLKWWESTQTQTQFGTTLQMTYGPTYMWDTANLEAFAQLPWPEQDKKVILEQWKYLEEVPKNPGYYMLERELSNDWNNVVFNGENTREAVEHSVNIVNQEFEKKLEEFGYMKNGKILKPYKIPSINEVKSWLGESNDQ